MELSTATSALFSASGDCTFCHDQWGRALTDSRGNSVSITEDWRGTMMAHSFQDPLWRAVMEAEVDERPDLKGFIENKCQTCHAPMARTQHQHDGRGELGHLAAKESALAADSVSCTLCHQIQPDNLGDPASFTGHYLIRETRQIFGPYQDVFTMPMLHHVDYTPQFGRHVQDSALCATCHTLYTPVLGEDNAVIGQFAEQTPYLEWRTSIHARNGTHCQDCHMQRLDEPIKVSARPPWLEGREPFWRHQFVGGNTFMLGLMSAQEASVEPNGTADNLAASVARARDQLRRAASLDVKGWREGQTLLLRVQVANLAGHKFPTGHPYRRAWLNVQVHDPRGELLFESGAVDPQGELAGIGTGFAPHYDEITRSDQVQIYESVMGDAGGERTYALLQAATYLKDNRIPPRGFLAAAGTADVDVKGRAVEDSNFNSGGNGADQVLYRVDLGGTTGPVKATLALLYQAVPPEAVARLKGGKGKASHAFTRYYAQANKAPETVQRIEVLVE